MYSLRGKYGLKAYRICLCAAVRVSRLYKVTEKLIEPTVALTW